MSETATLEAPAAETQDAKPTPDTQATALSQSEAPPSAQAGTDGEQPQAEATLQTADTPAEPAAPPAPPVPTLTAEEAIAVAERRIQERESRKAAEEAAQKTQAELRSLRRDGPKLARTTLNKIAEEANIVIPNEYREALEDWAENLALKSTDAAKLEMGDQATQTKLETEDLWMANIRGGIDPKNMPAFDKDIEAAGFTYGSIVKAAQKYAPPSPGVVTVDALVAEATAYAADAANNLSPEEQTALTKAVTGAKTAKAVIDALGKAMRGRGSRDPGAGVSGNPRSASGGPQSRLEAEQMHAGMHPSGVTITTAQMRKYIESGSI